MYRQMMFATVGLIALASVGTTLMAQHSGGCGGTLVIGGHYTAFQTESGAFVTDLTKKRDAYCAISCREIGQRIEEIADGQFVCRTPQAQLIGTNGGFSAGRPLNVSTLGTE